MNELQWSNVVGPLSGHIKDLMESNGTKVKGNLYQPLVHRFEGAAMVITSNHMISSDQLNF